MGDPVTMAIVGGSIGAMSNSKDPLKGALLGAAGGYGGATLMGAGGLTTGATQVAGTGSGLTGAGASNAANTMFANAGGVNSIAAGQSTNLLAPSAIDFSKGIGSSIYQTPMLGGGPTTGMVPSSLATPPGFLDQIGNYAQRNPVLTQMGMQSAQQMMQQPQAQFAPAGQIQRGGIQDVQIASALPQAPRISLI
jgi:hypothetical protein